MNDQTPPQLPAVGFVDIKMLCGDPKRGHPGIVGYGRSSWWNGCKAGRFPPPVRLGPNRTVWRVEQIRAYLADPSNLAAWSDSDQPDGAGPS